MSALSPAALAELGVSDPTAAAQQLEAYLGLVLAYGERLNLVGQPERGFVARDLILGSLQLLRAGPLRGRLVDVGSGAGLPGIPLAAVLPALHVTLIEPRQKRVAFLEKVVRSLALADRVEIIPEPVEAVLGGHLVGRTPPLPFDWAVARAFRPPAAWLELADRLLAPGGRAALYTTRRRFPSLAAVDPEGRFREVARVEDETGDDRLVVVVERVGDAA